MFIELIYMFFNDLNAKLNVWFSVMYLYSTSLLQITHLYF